MSYAYMKDKSLGIHGNLLNLPKFPLYNTHCSISVCSDTLLDQGVTILQVDSKPYSDILLLFMWYRR